MRKRILIWLGVIGLLVLLYDRTFRTLGVGFADMSVEFVVTDAETGLPISGVAVLGYGNIEGRGPDGAFRYEVGQDGIARVNRRTMFTSSESGLGWTCTYTTEPVWALVVIEAPGYEKTEEIDLTKPPYRGAAVRLAPGQWRLTVPISLRKAAP